MSSNSQQYYLLKERGIENVKPRRQFIIDFIEQFRETCKDDNNMTLLAIDGNEALSTYEPGGIKELIETCGLVNAYTMFHKDNDEFPTHENGSKTIDYLLCTPNLLQYISKIGYLKFNEGYDSDHRGIYCDFLPTITTQTKTNDTKILRRRMVGSNSTNKEGEEYNRQLYNHLKNNNIINKAKDLLQKLKNGIVDHVSDLDNLNKMDKIITDGKLKAEKDQCTKKDMSLWTPEIKQSHLKIQYWNIKIKTTRQRTTAEKRINTILSKMNKESINSIITNTKSLTRALRNEIKQHKKLLIIYHQQRRKYLSQLVEDFNERNTTPRTSIKQTMQREQSRNDFRTIKNIISQKRSKGLTFVDIPDPNNPNKTIRLTDPKEMTEKILTRNIKHFSQAEGTPFTNLGKIPKECMSENEYVQALIQNLGKKKMKDLEKDITYYEFIKGIEKWNEKTTTSPSGRHLEHYKLLTKLKIKDKNNKHLIISDTILETYYNIFLCSIYLEYPLQRWTEITTIMIEKSPGNARIEKLRVIHLFEADYNLLLKIMWARKTVWSAHKRNTLNPGQAGSKPGCRAIDVAILKEMKYNYATLTRTTLATIDNDARSCFDCILCNVSMLISRHFGVPLNYCKLKANTLKNTKYKISTGKGESTKTYQHSKLTPVHGTGQGSCSSPAIWLLVSSFLMNILQEKGQGMTMHSTKLLAKAIKQWIEGFVDDTSIFTNLQFNNQNLQDLKNMCQSDGQTWEGLLSVSGGELELLKCFYYLLSWTWDKNGNPIPQSIIQQQTQQVQIKLSKTGDITNLEQKEVQTSHKTLGTHKCVVGKETEQYNKLLEKSNNIAAKIRQSQLNKRQGWLAYCCNYIPVMCYSLTAVSMSESELNKIQRQATTQFTRICGYEQTFPKAVVHGPLAYGGLGFHKLYVESNCAKIQTIICHINKNTVLGKLMLLILDWVQIHSGIDTPILEDTTTLDYIQTNWFTQIREFLIQSNATLKIKQTEKYSLLRKNDGFIMKTDELIKYSPSLRKLINNWRVYFQVINISEITNYAGTYILPEFMNKKHINNYSTRTTRRWPHQKQPCLSTFHLWSSFIQKRTKCDNTGRLPKPLGKWEEHPNLRIQNNFMIHTTKQKIIIKHDTTWKLYLISHEHHGTTYFYKQTTAIIKQPSNKKYFPMDYTTTNKFYQVKNQEFFFNLQYTATCKYYSNDKSQPHRIYKTILHKQ